MTSDLPTVRWGIVATGMISSWFVEDLVLPRKDAKAKHIIQSIGSSSVQKGKDFVAKHIPNISPTIYGSYEEVYADPDVDVVYIGTPHAFHKKNCLDAIAAGKNVLCEKAFTLNARDAEEVVAAAKAKGTFLMEAMWTRFKPLMQTLQKMLHQDKVIGDVHRTFCDFGLQLDVASLPPESRYKDPALGAGSLLDIGIYALTWGLVSLDPGLGVESEMPEVLAQQTLSDGVDLSSSMLLFFPSTGRQGIITSTTNIETMPSFCRIEGSTGYITVDGPAPSSPHSLTVFSKRGGFSPDNTPGEESVVKATVKLDLQGGRGFFWEADAVALDIAAGRKENAVMPFAETVRVMKIMDNIRRQGGARFPQDHE